MNRPDSKGATVIDTDGADAGAAGDEVDNGAQDAGDAAGDAAESQQGDDTVQDAGGEDAAAGGDGEGDAGEAGSEDGASESGADAGEVDPIESRLAAFEEKLLESLEQRFGRGVAPARGAEGAAPQAKEPTDEEWATLEEQRGVPRTAQKWVAQSIQRGVNAAIEHVEKMIEERFGGSTTTLAIERLSRDPKFSDAKKFSPQIEKYLQKFHPRDRTRPDLLRDAVVFARGLASQGAVRRAASGQKPLRVIGGGRPAAGSGKGGAPARPQKALNPTERAAARLLEGGEREYRALAERGRKGAFKIAS